MREPERFRQMVRGRLGTIGRTQQELARAIGLHPSVLSHKLHGRDSATLTQADVVRIVQELAAWGALTTQAEARALLATMAVPPHALPASAWAAPPFAALAPDATPASRADAPPAPSAPAPATPVGTAPSPVWPIGGTVYAALTASPLPEPSTPLIGRTAERAAVHAALAAARLVTLTGVGGIGKTCLALRAAREAADAARFPDGVAFADLAPLRDPALLAPTLARALGLAEQPALAPEAQLTQALRDRALLLVADNLEHLLEETPLLGRLLAAAPRLRILATSRVPLRLYGEHEIRVPPLPLPTNGAATGVDGAGLPSDPADSEAMQLFVARARAVAPGFAPQGAERAAVAAICAALDGLPLAIELAAARVKLFPPATLLSRLGARLALLTDGPRDRPERQRTLRAALDWSYALLTSEERALFARLGVFAGPFDAAAAAAVCAPDDDVRAAGGSWGLTPEVDAIVVDPRADWMVGLLVALADQSLLEVAPGPIPRFRLLETVRAYALAHLVEEGAREAIGERHLRYYRALAETAGAALRGPEQGAWLARLEAEHANLRAALAWARDRGATAEGLRLAGALWRFWELHGHLREGQGWLEAALAAQGDTPDPVLLPARARALRGAGRLAWQQGDYTRAVARHAEALALWRRLGDEQGVASALTSLGNVASRQGDDARAVALHAESLALRRRLGDTSGVAIALGNLGRVALQQGDDTRAAALLEESLALQRRLGDTWGVAAALSGLGRVAARQGDYDRATTLLEESLTLKRALGDPWGSATALSHLGRVAFLQGDGARAATLLGESLRLGGTIGTWDRVAEALESLAAVAVRSRPRAAARLGGAAAALRAALDLPLLQDQRASHDRMAQAARAALGEDVFAAAWAAGQARPLEETIAGALEETIAGALGETIAEALEPGEQALGQVRILTGERTS